MIWLSNCRTLSESYDQPDCVHIPALDVPAGIAMNTVVSDSDDYDAVLPLSVVKSINIYEGTRQVYSSARYVSSLPKQKRP